MSLLPQLYEDCHSFYIKEAYDRIKTFYDTGHHLLHHPDVDIIQLKVAADNIRLRSFPLLDNLIHADVIPRDWLEEVSDCTHEVEEGLRTRALSMRDQLGVIDE